MSEFDFDLPEVETPKAVKPRLHVSDETCVSCQG